MSNINDNNKVFLNLYLRDMAEYYSSTVSRAKDFLSSQGVNTNKLVSEGIEHINNIVNASCGAKFSDCKKYRYALWRIWDHSKPKIMFIGLNPSRANRFNDDPTIRRVVAFARQWGYGGVYMVNLFAFVTPYPKELSSCLDPIGDNDHYMELVARNCSEVVFAWGRNKDAQARSVVAEILFPNAKCLAKNGNGSPKHPLYVKGDTKLILYNQI